MSTTSKRRRRRRQHLHRRLRSIRRLSSLLSPRASHPATRRGNGETFFALSSLLPSSGRVPPAPSCRPSSTLPPFSALASLRGQARSNPDVTAPLSVSLGRPHGQCSLFLYIHAFHRVGLAPHTFPLVARRGYPDERLPVETMLSVRSECWQLENVSRAQQIAR